MSIVKDTRCCPQFQCHCGTGAVGKETAVMSANCVSVRWFSAVSVFVVLGVAHFASAQPGLCCSAQSGCQPIGDISQCGPVFGGVEVIDCTDCQDPGLCCYTGGCSVVPDCSGIGGVLVVDCNQCIPGGPDCWETECGETRYDFCETPIPADFFAP